MWNNRGVWSRNRRCIKAIPTSCEGPNVHLKSFVDDVSPGEEDDEEEFELLVSPGLWLHMNMESKFLYDKVEN